MTRSVLEDERWEIIGADTEDGRQTLELWDLTKAPDGPALMIHEDDGGQLGLIGFDSMVPLDVTLEFIALAQAHLSDLANDP